MEKYLQKFQANGIDTLSKVTQLNEEDLNEMGIKLVGHRNKMKKSIKVMNSQHHNKGMDEEEAAIQTGEKTWVIGTNRFALNSFRSFNQTAASV